MRGRPNVLLVFTDQQRADTIGALGNPVIRTPNLDRLVREGVAFTNAFTPSPVCIAARCSLIFGQYPHNTGCYENTKMPQDGRQTMMEALTRAGYRTHGIGKCHFRPDPHGLWGFESRETQEEIARADRDDYLQYLQAQGYGHIKEAHGLRSEMYYIPQPAQMPAEHHPTQWVGDRAVAFIEEQAGSDRPWFLYVGFIHPHPPWALPVPWNKLYRAVDMPLPNVPADWEALLTYQNRFQNRYKYRDQGIDLNLVRCMKAYYYAAVSFVDYQVGKILHALQTTGQLDNTLIVFTSDHGELLGDFNSFGKRSMHDASSRVPFIVRFPGVYPAGMRCDTPVSLVDIAPTVLAAAGAEITTHSVDGVDLAQLYHGAHSRSLVFAQHGTGPLATYMAVSKEWKYFYSAADDAEFLFDRMRDPFETRNRANVSLYRAEQNLMKEALIRHLQEAGETAGIENGDWRRFPVQRIPSNPDAGLLIQDPPGVHFEIPGYSDI